MHGMQSIVSRTKHKVTSALHRSNQLLQAAIEKDPTVGEGGPPGGIPVTPAAIIKPNLTLEPRGVRRKRDCFQIEVITIDDESTENEENRGDKDDHDTTNPYKATTASELNNNEGSKQPQKQVDQKKEDKAVWGKLTKTEQKAKHPSRATEGKADTQKREVATQGSTTHKTGSTGSRIGKPKSGGGEQTREREKKQNKDRIETMVIAINAAEKANAKKIKNDKIDTSETKASETETIGQTGPQAMRTVVRYCEAIRRQVVMWIAEENGEREKKRPLHWKLTERHPRGGQDRNKSLYLQLTDCKTRLQNTWQQHIGVFLTSGDSTTGENTTGGRERSRS